MVLIAAPPRRQAGKLGDQIGNPCINEVTTTKKFAGICYGQRYGGKFADQFRNAAYVMRLELLRSGARCRIFILQRSFEYLAGLTAANGARLFRWKIRPRVCHA